VTKRLPPTVTKPAHAVTAAAPTPKRATKSAQNGVKKPEKGRTKLAADFGHPKNRGKSPETVRNTARNTRNTPPIEPKPRRPKPGQPEHVPTETTQAKVTIWSGGGIDLEAIAVALGISKPTLLKHYALQLSVGKVTMDGLAISAIARAMRGDGKESVLAAKFWAVCRMGWTERFIVDDARLRDTPLQITVELVGGAEAPPEQRQRAKPRLSFDPSLVDLVG
jgi:hypothetical protein